MEDDPLPGEIEDQALATIRVSIPSSSPNLESGIWNLESRKAPMSQIEHFAIYADDSTALKDFYVGAFGLHVIFESGGDPPAYFLADDHGMAIEVLGRPPGNSGVNRRWVCHLALWVDDVPGKRAELERTGDRSSRPRPWLTTTSSRRRFSPIPAATAVRSSGGRNGWDNPNPPIPTRTACERGSTW